MDGRRLFHPRGKLLGGSSSVNAMVYVRGHAEDYNRWAFKEGATGWSYEECLPYFVKSEVVLLEFVLSVFIIFFKLCLTAYIDKLRILIIFSICRVL